jgi:signal transduction histidine kinase
LGRDLTAEPIKETGPLEVRAAARAFNSMQRKLLKQIEARTGMLASISHDLRTPITQMRLRTELLPASENRSKTLDTLDDMNAIIGTFLDFARVSADSEARTVVEFSSLVESICHDFADRGEDVSFSGPSDVRYPCKRVAMKRALSNLIQNAVAYGIRARVNLSQEIDELILTVDDDGPGIREEEMAVVFQPFRRLQSSSPNHKDGVGLGLSIAQSIVEDHGGSISLRNRHHGGLSVTVRLPVPE